MAANYTPDGKLDLADLENLNADTIVEFLRLATSLKSPATVFLTAPAIHDLFDKVFPHHQHLKEEVFSRLTFADPNDARSFLWKTSE